MRYLFFLPLFAISGCIDNANNFLPEDKNGDGFIHVCYEGECDYIQPYEYDSEYQSISFPSRGEIVMQNEVVSLYNSVDPTGVIESTLFLIGDTHKEEESMRYPMEQPINVTDYFDVTYDSESNNSTISWDIPSELVQFYVEDSQHQFFDLVIKFYANYCYAVEVNGLILKTCGRIEIYLTSEEEGEYQKITNYSYSILPKIHVNWLWD